MPPERLEAVRLLDLPTQLFTTDASSSRIRLLPRHQVSLPGYTCFADKDDKDLYKAYAAAPDEISAYAGPAHTLLKDESCTLIAFSQGFKAAPASAGLCMSLRAV